MFLLGPISSETTRLPDSGSLPAIAIRTPTFYATLNGTGSATDQSGNGIAIDEHGVSRSKSANGWTLGDGVYLEADHDAVFETDDSSTRFGWVDSEVTVVFEVVFSSLASRVSVASKADGSRFANSWWLDAETDGSLRLVVEDSQSKHLLQTAAGTVTTGTRYHIAIQFGRLGLQMWVDGNSSSNGWSLLEHWYGWDHRVRGGPTETLVDGERWVNNHPLRIGHNGVDANGEVQVRHWAVFVSGDTDYDPWVRTGTRLARADIEAIAGVSGTGDLDASHQAGGSTINIATGDRTAARKSAIEGASAGDTIVLATGTHTISDDLTIPSGVRMIGGSSNRADTVLDLTGTISKTVTGSGEAWLSLTSRDNHGDLSQGDYSISLTDTSGIEEDDIILIVSTVEHEVDVYGTTGSDAFRKRSDLVSVDSVGPNSVTFRQTLRRRYTAAERAHVYRLRPAWKNNTLENLTIKADAGVASTAGEYPALEVPGLVGAKFRNVKVHQTATEDNQRCATFHCAINLELIQSEFDSDANSTGTGNSHPYACQLLAGRDIRAKDTSFSTDWADGLDPNFNNALQELGTNQGISDHVACRWVEQIDCTTTVGHPSVGIGGHEREARRLFCCTTDKGMTFSRGSYSDESWGVVCNYRQGNMTEGSLGIHHGIDYTAASDGGGVYKQFSGDRQKDTIFSEVRGSGSSIDPGGTYSGLEFVNCDEPYPGST